MRAAVQPSKDRRVLALGHASARRRRQSDALRAQLAAQRAQIAEREAELDAAQRQAEQDAATMHHHANRLDELTNGAQTFSPDVFNQCRAYLGVATERWHKSGAQVHDAQRALDEAIAVMRETNRTIARNLGVLDACARRIATFRAAWQRAEDEAVDDEIEDSVLARYARIG